MSSFFKFKRERCKAQFWYFSSIPFDYISYFSMGNFFEHDWLVIQIKTFTQILFSVLFSAFRGLHTLNFMCLESVSLLFLDY